MTWTFRRCGELYELRARYEPALRAQAVALPSHDAARAFFRACLGDAGAMAALRSVAPARDDARVVERVATEVFRGRLWLVRRADVVATAAAASPPVTTFAPAEPPPPDRVPDPWDLVDLAYVDRIAPGAEAEVPRIRWTIRDPDELITEGRLEVVRADAPAESEVVWTRRLPSSERSDGEHELEWDGRITASEEFPDGYVSVEFSPYTIRLTLAGSGKCMTSAETFVVEAVALELALGPRAWLSDARDLALYDGLAALPAPGETARLPLVSNIFARDSAYFDPIFPESFEGYATLWGDGPRVPVEARVWFLDSLGERVLAPRAWGRRRVLWDWACVDPDLASLHAEARAFVEEQQAYAADATRPPGQNCHEDRGGKRSATGAPRVLSGDAGGAFPVEVTAATRRVHGALSGPARTGDRAGATGVVFRPARQAGDGYRLAAWFDRRRDLDTEGEVAADHGAETGTFRVWREVHLARYLKKREDLPGFLLEPVQATFDGAFLRVEDGGALPGEVLDGEAYNAGFLAASEAPLEAWLAHALDPSVDQFATGRCAVTFRCYEDFVASARAERAEAVLPQVQAESPGMTREEALGTARVVAEQQVERELGEDHLGTRGQYADRCNEWATQLCERACAPLVSTDDGVTVFEFQDLHSEARATTTRTIAGFVAPAQNPGPSRALVVLCGPVVAGLSPTGLTNEGLRSATMAHELGHALFLPHAPLPHDDLPGGAISAAHDPDDPRCLMGYQQERAGFCGLCQLRLRGWDMAFRPEPPAPTLLPIQDPYGPGPLTDPYE